MFSEASIGKIAITGAGLRLPGGISSLDQLWKFLIAGGDAIRDLPDGRWSKDLYDPGGGPGRTYVRRAGYIDDIEQIDTAFFNVSPKEAVMIDPQQRLLVQTAFEALENAGLSLDTLRQSRTGVFVGISSSDYGQLLNQQPRHSNAYTNTGGALSIAANRISYLFDLRGPSLAIDTACSSGLTALDSAVRAMRDGACDLAIVAGVNALLKPEPFVGFCAAKMLSPVAQCRAFDADGAGFVRAEGAVSYVLKPLDRAISDNDPILGVILGSDANNDGRTAGLSLPNMRAQIELIERVLEQSGVHPDEIGYVEAHGTGTAAGDPIEAEAIGRAIATKRSNGASLPIGSVKTNLGHLEPASGLAGLAKALLCLKYGEIPPSLHFDTPNPQIDFAGLRIEVADKRQALREEVIGVNSFGFGGANAHVLVARPPERTGEPKPEIGSSWYMISARSSDALAAGAQALADHVESNPENLLYDVAGTLALRRTHHPQRAAVWADSREELRAGLLALAKDEGAPNVVSGSALPAQEPVFVFTGNGSQWWGMGRELLASSVPFRETVEEIDAIVRSCSDIRLIDEFSASEAGSRMHLTEIAQPALFALQLGLVRLLDREGLSPAAVVGHSAGELAAAAVSGAFDLEAITRIVIARSHHQARTAGQGGMVALGMGAQDAEAYLATWPDIVVAGDNSPNATTLAGPHAQIDALVDGAAVEGLFARKLDIDYPFHSPAMDPIERGFRDDIGDVRGRETARPFYSTVTGTRIEGVELDADYWWRNLRQPVKFRDAIEALQGDGHGIYVEVGPHPNLLRHIRSESNRSGVQVRLVETLRQGEPETDSVRRSVISSAVVGAQFDHARRFQHPVEPVALPNYAWQNERHYVDPANASSVSGQPTGHPFLGARLPTDGGNWIQEFSLGAAPFVSDHVVRERVLFPAAGFLEIALAAGLVGDPNSGIEIDAFRIGKALTLRNDDEVIFQTSHDLTDNSLTIASQKIADASERPAFEEHVSATVRRQRVQIDPVDIADVRSRLHGSLSGEHHYARAAQRGLNYGEAFRVVERLETGDGEVLATLVRRKGETEAYHLDPTLVDGALQAMIGLIGTADDNRLFLPVEVARARIPKSSRIPDRIFSHVKARGQSRFHLTADITLIDEDGEALAALEGVQVRVAQRRERTSAQILRHQFVPFSGLEAGIPRMSVKDLLAAYRPSELNLRRRLCSDHYNSATEEAVALYAAEAFRKFAGSRAFTIEALVSDGKLAAKHRHYATVLLEIAKRHGTAEEIAPGRWRIVTRRKAAKSWRDGYRSLPQFAADWLCIARIGSELPDILSGRADPLGILFSDDSATMEQVYNQGFSSLEANEILAQSVRKLAEEISPHRPVRILEVGGGTGGTAGHILRALNGFAADYLFTDVSSSFLRHAESKFGDYPSFRTAVFDLEASEQDLFENRFDIVVCANVVHATKSVRESLRALKRMLCANGVLMLSEIQRCAAFDFVFGPLPDVWRFEDRDDRPSHALLGSQEWETILQTEGFDDVQVLGDMPSGQTANLSVAFAVNRDDSAAGAAIREPAGQSEKLCFLVDNGSALAAQTAACMQQAGHQLRTVDLSDILASVSAEEATLARWAEIFEGALGESSNDILFFVPTHYECSTSDVVWPLIAMMKAAGNVAGLRRLILVTEGLEDCADVAGAASAYWAVGRVIVNEYPSWSCLRIDCAPDADARARLADVLASGDLDDLERGEDELRVTAQGIQANRLSALPEEPIAGARSDADAFTFTLSAQGSLESLKAYRTDRAEQLADGDVEIRIMSAGINFKDVMLTLGVLPPDLFRESAIGPRVGLEGAGTIERVGRKVNSLTVGDKVFFMAEGSFASHIVMSADAVHRFPEAWSFQEAATLPVVGLTTIYALLVVAKLRRGETLLVHGGAGGVGMAAIQIAQSIGARVIATAGNPEKRDLLRALRVEHVSDSRSLAFVDYVREHTGGEGVDVVLNSLAGQPMLASLDLMKPFGRFIEIGKRDFEENSRLNLRALEMNISYHAVDLTYLWESRPDLFVRSWKKLVEKASSGALRPLPFRQFPASELPAAMRFMQSGRHMGKLVADLRDPAIELSNSAIPPTVQFSPKGAYVIAGGLGGIGLEIAKWLASRGAGGLVLVGRHGVTDEGQREAIRQLEADGVRVVVRECDIADPDQVNALVDETAAAFGSIRGVFNAALILDDRLISDVTRESVRKVISPKADGALNLHRATIGHPLECFVVFSSIANVFGNPGQANYVAGNAFMEQLVMARRLQGLPGSVLQLGPVGDVGILRRDQRLRDAIGQVLGATISSGDVLATLDRLLVNGPAIVAVTGRHARVNAPIESTGRLAAMIGEATSVEGEEIDLIDLANVPSDQRLATMEGFLLSTAAAITGAHSDRIDLERSLGDLGLDSLMAVEFSHVLEERLEITVSPADIAQDRNLRELALILIGRLQLPDTPGFAPDSEAALQRDEIDNCVDDAVLPPDIGAADPVPALPLCERELLLLTGATGFLGKFLLSEILDRGARKVICVVRGDGDRGAEDRLRTSLCEAGLDVPAAELGKSVEVWAGDVSRPQFGLSSDRWRFLESNADAVLHNSANVGFVESYPAIKPANVDSLTQLIGLASQGCPKSLHFVSSLRVYSHPEQVGATDPIDEDVLPMPPLTAEGGYVKTKWVAEQIAREARQRGYSIEIYRPSFIIGRSSDGYSSVTDVVSAFTRLALELGILPDLQIAFPMIPVDVAARQIVTLLDAAGETKEAHHITDWPSLSMPEIKDCLSDVGVDAQSLEVEEFVSKAADFLARNPRHPAIWLPTFLRETPMENNLGRLISKPSLPEGIQPTPDIKQVISRMMQWLQTEL